MSLNFPSNPADNDTYNGYVYNATKGVWNKIPTTTDSISEGDNNLYFTDQRALDATASAYDATGSAAAAESAANSYTDGEISTLDTSLKSYADTAESDAVTTANSYTDTTVADYAPLAGATFTGDVVLNADPTQALGAATKQYVDSLGEGLVAKPAVKASTSNNATGTYDNGTAGVGATFTFPAMATFNIDGVTSWELYDGLLLRSQTNAAENGRYVLTTVGDGSTPWVFTRCGLCDEADEIPGAYIFVTDGVNSGQTGWVLHVDDPATFTVGTDDIDVYQFAGAGTYSAGTGLQLDGTQFSIDTSVTATTSYADTAEADAISTANAYTDGRETAITSAYQSYADTAEADAISTAAADATSKANTAESNANTYTDGRETAITTAYEAYADQAEADAISTASADATSKANTAESNANTYTDSLIGDGTVDGTSGNTVTDRIATAVSSLVDSAPETLDTLNELAAALGDDENFSTTITNAIAAKADLASPSFTGTVDFSNAGVSGLYLALSDLTDVTIGAGHIPSDGNALVWSTEISQWIPGEAGGGASFTVSETAPESPEDGDVWYNSSTGRTYIYYVDTDSSQWVEIGGANGADGADGENGTYIVASTSLPTSGDGEDGDLWIVYS